MLKGSDIKIFRMRKNIPLDRFADKLGISSQALSQIENDEQVCSPVVEEKFFQLYENLFNRADKEKFKERFPYSGIRLMGDNLKHTSERVTTDVLENENIIKKLRKKLSYSQKDFAHILGIDPSVLSNLETGTCRLTPNLYDYIYSKYSGLLSECEKLELEKMTRNSYKKVVNFVINNDIDFVFEQIIDMKLDKKEINLLFNELLVRAKVLKKDRS